MVIHLGALKDGRDSYVFDDIKAVVDAADGALVKVIIETCLLSDTQKVRACELAVRAGAQFVKTSTGFGPGGAAVHDVALMRKTVGPDIGVKGLRRYPYTTGRARHDSRRRNPSWHKRGRSPVRRAVNRIEL